MRPYTLAFTLVLSSLAASAFAQDDEALPPSETRTAPAEPPTGEPPTTEPPTTAPPTTAPPTAESPTVEAQRRDEAPADDLAPPPEPSIEEPAAVEPSASRELTAPVRVDAVEAVEETLEVQAVETDPAGPEAVEPDAIELEPAEPELAPREVVGSTPRHLFGQSFGAWFELGISGGGRGAERADFVVSPELGLRFRPDRGVYVAAAFGFTVAATQIAGEQTIGGAPVAYQGSPGRIEPGNPTMELGFSGAVAPNLRLEIGVGAAIPTAARAQPGADAPTLVERSASEVTVRAAAAMRGHWSPWRWAPERFALYAPVRLAAAFGDFRVEGDIGVGVMVPVLGDSNADPDVIVQLGAGVGGRVAEPLYLGVRLRGVGAPLGTTLTGTDALGEAATEAVVFSAEPWVRLRLDPVQVTLRGVVSFNGADGVAGDRAPPFGVFVGVGGEVD